MKEKVKDLPSVDEVLKSPCSEAWLRDYPRRYVLQSIREVIDRKRKLILEGMETPSLSISSLAPEIDSMVKHLCSYSLMPVINATGIVVHTNLGRAVLGESALRRIEKIALSYSNLEYDLQAGTRGKRHSHLKRLLRDVTGAEDGTAVNNNAGAVLLSLAALARGREVIVSRGELVEIGGSFRIPDVMASSGAILKEVGTTNKTHVYDYENAISENTALILKVHQSNYKITGFTEDVSLEELSSLGQRHNIPVMYDMGSGCLIDLKPYAIHGEPVVRDALRAGAHIVTFSGDKLLGGPQAGIIAGKKEYIGRIQKNPLARALRIDKLTLAGLEATLMEYIDEEKAKTNIPTLRMLLEPASSIKQKAGRLSKLLAKRIKNAEINVLEDSSQAGGGALPQVNLKTFVVSIKPELSLNLLEERLRKGTPPVIARIKEESLILDLRTVSPDEIETLANCLSAAIQGGS